MSAKVFQINMDIPTDEISYNLLTKQPDPKTIAEYRLAMSAWQKLDPKTRGAQPEVKTYQMDGAEFMRMMVLNAISQCHKSGNTKVLRRTKAIADQFSIALAKGTTICLVEDDYNFIKTCMEKADQWTNDEAVAKSVLVVEDAILDAEEITNTQPA